MGQASTVCAPGDDGSAEETLLAQVRDFEPDVVYVQDVHYLTDDDARDG